MDIDLATSKAEDFINSIKLNNVSSKTIRSYQQDITNFFSYISKETDGKVVGKKELKAFFADMYMRELAPATIKRSANDPNYISCVGSHTHGLVSHVGQRIFFRSEYSCQRTVAKLSLFANSATPLGC